MRVLVAEDQRIARMWLRARLLAWGYDVEEAAGGEEAWARLREPGGPRLALLDWIMPGLEGPEICRRVRALGREPYVYLILLTGRDRREDVVEGLGAGADDYMAKPFHDSELEVRLRAGRRIVELQAELVAAREALREQATRDGLTGLWNRREILDRLARESARCERDGGELSVVVIDVDHFKRVNDTLGHAAGDGVLREIASRLGASVRPADVVGRVGGEEFLVVLPGCDHLRALGVAERLRVAVSREPVRALGREIPVTASFGVAGRRGPVGPEALVALADAALYAAKRAGRNRTQLATGAP